VLDLINGLSELQIYLLAGGLILQGMLVAVFPEEVIVITMGLLWAQGKVHFLPTLLVIQVCLMPADFWMAFLGNKVGGRLLKRKGVEEALEYVRRYGAWVIFLTRFTPTIRGAVYLAYGISGLSLKKFFKTDYLASCIHIPLLLLIGKHIGETSSSITDAYKKVGITAGAILGTAIVAIIIHERRRRRRLTSGSRPSGS